MKGLMLKMNTQVDSINKDTGQKVIHKNDYGLTVFSIVVTAFIALLAIVVTYFMLQPKKASPQYVLSLMDSTMVQKFTEYGDALLNDRKQTIAVFEQDKVIKNNKRTSSLIASTETSSSGE